PYVRGFEPARQVAGGPALVRDLAGSGDESIEEDPCAVRHGVEEVGLPLQLARVRPPVVAVEQGQIAPPRRTDSTGYHLVGAQVPLGKDKAYPVGNSRGIATDDLARAVGRGVLAYENLYGKGGPLVQGAFDRSADMRGMIACRDEDRDAPLF